MRGEISAGAQGCDREYRVVIEAALVHEKKALEEILKVLEGDLPNALVTEGARTSSLNLYCFRLAARLGGGARQHEGVRVL